MCARSPHAASGSGVGELHLGCCYAVAGLSRVLNTHGLRGGWARPGEAWRPGLESYINRYRNGWGAAAAAARALMDEARRRRKSVPGALPVSEMPVPLPMKAFAWPQQLGRGRGLTKCGRCAPCTRPQMRKACLNPVPSRPNGSLDDNDALSKCAPSCCKTARSLSSLSGAPRSEGPVLLGARLHLCSSSLAGWLAGWL
jgi:hypothetical protein